MMIRIFILIFILSIFGPARAATVTNAVSASYADVSGACAPLTDGDTVNVPFGIVTWASTLTLTKAISLKGAGSSSTKITASGPAVTLIDYTAVGADVPFEISGFWLVGKTNHSVPLLKVKGKDGSGVGQQITKLGIHDNFWEFGFNTVFINGWVYGVGWRNTFLNYNAGFVIVGDDVRAYLRPIEPGSTNAFYVESNTFLANNNAITDPNEAIYRQEGARTVDRFNIFDGSARTVGSTTFQDSHGNWSGGGPPVSPDSSAATNFQAQPLLESYGNTYTVGTVNFIYNLRGGLVFVYSNAVTVASGGSFGFPVKIEEEEYNTLALFSPLRTNYPPKQGLEGYFWANTLGGSPWTSAALHLADPLVLLQLNRDFFLAAPTVLNGVPSGTYENYAPLAFPHPLRAYFDGGSSPTISSVANQSIAQDASTGALPFTIGDASDPPSTLGLSVTSSNHTLADDVDCVLGGVGANRTVNITPNTGQTGVTTIKLIVTNSSLLTATNTFTVTVAGSLPIITGSSKLKGNRGRIK